MASRNYSNAITHFTALDSNTSLANNGLVLTDLGKAYYFLGELSKAITVLQRLHSLDSLNLKGMEFLSSLLCEEKRVKELESLATRLMSDSPTANEPCIAFGYLCLAQKKPSKALYFAHKAATTGRDTRLRLEGMILK